ncbi:flagellar hook-basal body protein [Aquibacillus salsiterrae]|uniref:Flagellar hook-basal body protein n=1 Tax=Aquibacillus salsiterrae TaxID=2950439 RepID=A0A9X3WFX5_9BACI|nr:flagellar hook-basal body protein [Aquibacillus salsiterrae]MDC3416714.1 flagellar hook-basal body protein [Aquibacillus salsiterrae]
MSRIAMQAAVTMGQLQNKLDVIGNNMANVDTTGFKTRNAEFSSLLVQQINNLSAPENAQGRLTPDGIRVGAGARMSNTTLDLKAGALKETGRALDLALLKGNHFFQIAVTENGETETRYTRAGNFYLNPLGNDQVAIATADGFPLLGADGPVVLADNMEAISITSTGAIEVTRNGQTAVEGQLQVVEAVRPRLLEATGNNNFRLSEQSLQAFDPGEIIPVADEAEVQIKSGSLENSNVDVAKQMTDLVTTQRVYQLNARSISMNDQMMGLINQLR